MIRKPTEGKCHGPESQYRRNRKPCIAGDLEAADGLRLTLEWIHERCRNVSQWRQQFRPLIGFERKQVRNTERVLVDA